MINVSTRYTLDDLAKLEGISKDNALTFMLTLKGKNVMYPSDTRVESMMGRITDVMWNPDKEEVILEMEMHGFSTGFGYVVGKGIEKTIGYEAILYRDNKNILVAQFQVEDIFRDVEKRLRYLENKVKHISLRKRIKRWFK